MIIAPNRVPKFFSHARDMLMINVAPYTWLPKSNAVETAFSWMQPACRYSLDEVVELPPVVYRTAEVELSGEQQETYKKVATAMATMVKEKQITAVNAGVAMNKLLQIAGGWVYTTRPEFVRLDPTPRVVAMADLIRSCTEKVLVSIPYRHMIEGISKDPVDERCGYRAHLACTGIPPAARKSSMRSRTPTSTRCSWCNPQCIAHGLTLTAASMIVWYLPTTSLENLTTSFNARITPHWAEAQAAGAAPAGFPGGTARLQAAARPSDDPEPVSQSRGRGDRWRRMTIRTTRTARRCANLKTSLGYDPDDPTITVEFV
jgi:hypothetical protein